LSRLFNDEVQTTNNVKSSKILEQIEMSFNRLKSKSTAPEWSEPMKQMRRQVENLVRASKSSTERLHILEAIDACEVLIERACKEPSIPHELLAYYLVSLCPLIDNFTDEKLKRGRQPFTYEFSTELCGLKKPLRSVRFHSRRFVSRTC
jgi:hypothetical protein